MKNQFKIHRTLFKEVLHRCSIPYDPDVKYNSDWLKSQPNIDSIKIQVDIARACPDSYLHIPCQHTEVMMDCRMCVFNKHKIVLVKHGDKFFGARLLGNSVFHDNIIIVRKLNIKEQCLYTTMEDIKHIKEYVNVDFDLFSVNKGLLLSDF